MLRALNQVSGVFCLSDAASDLPEINAGKRISFMRRRQKVAHGAWVAGAQHKNPAPANFRPCAVHRPMRTRLTDAEQAIKSANLSGSPARGTMGRRGTSPCARGRFCAHQTPSCARRNHHGHIAGQYSRYIRHRSNRSRSGGGQVVEYQA